MTIGISRGEHREGVVAADDTSEAYLRSPAAHNDVPEYRVRAVDNTTYLIVLTGPDGERRIAWAYDQAEAHKITLALNWAEGL
jgi:hypothetical protein